MVKGTMAGCAMERQGHSNIVMQKMNFIASRFIDDEMGC